jgi:hypothetical protein
MDKEGAQVTIYMADNGLVELVVGKAADDAIAGGLNLDIQQLFALLGEPSWVYPWGCDPSRSCACDPSHTLLSYLDYPPVLPSVDLLYPNRGASYNFSVVPEDSGCVCPYMKLNTFVYFAPVSSPAEYVKIITGPPYHEDRVKEYHFIPWHGLGPGYARTNPELP